MIIDFTYNDNIQLQGYYGISYTNALNALASAAPTAAVDSIQEALHVYFVGQATVTTAVGYRIFWLEAPPLTAYPYVTYYVVSDPHAPFAFGRTDAGQAVVRMAIYDDNKTEALRIAHVVRDSINQHGGATGTLNMEAVYCDRPQTMKVIDQNIYCSMFNLLVEYDDV